MARNLSWIDKRKLNSLLSDEDDETPAAAPERPRGLLDDDEEPAPASRFEARRAPSGDRFGGGERRFQEPPPREAGPPATFLGSLPDEPPAPPPFPEPAGGWRPEPDPPAPRARFQEPAGEVSERLPADDDTPFALPHDENVLETSDNPDLDGLATALDAMPLEAFATSGPSSFDLPPSAPEAAPTPAPPEPEALPQAAAIVDEAAQFNPFDQSPATDPGLAVPDPLAGDDDDGDLDAAEDPEQAFAAAFGAPEAPPSAPPPIEELELPAASLEELSPVAGGPPLDAPPVDGPAPIEDIALPSAELLNPTLDVERVGFSEEEARAAYTLELDDATGATGVTGDTGSQDDEPGFASPDFDPPPSSTRTGREPPPRVEGEAIELTCERFFDWVLDHVGLDGGLVADQDGLPIAERGFHELLPALLAEALPLARGLTRLHGAPKHGHVYLERGRLHVVIVWCLDGDRARVAGLSGLAQPQTLSGLSGAFAALFGGEP